MEEQDDEIVVRQKLVTDEIENDMDDEQINLNSSSVGTTIAAATTIHHQNSNLSKSSSILPILSNISNNNNNKENIKEINSKHYKTKNLITVTTGIAPISPILSIKQMFSSGETTRTQDSSNCSIDKGINSDNVIGGVGSDSAGAVGGTIGTGGGNGFSENGCSDSTISNIVGYGNGIAVSNNNSGQHPSATRVIFVNERKQQQHNFNNNTNNNINNNNNNINNNNNNNINNNNNNLQDGKLDNKAKARKAQRDPSNIVDTHDFQNTFENRRLKHHSFLSEVPDVRHMEEALLGLLDDFHTGKLTAFGPGCTMEQMTDIREQQERLAKLHFELVSKCTDNNDNDNINITTGSSNNSNKRNSKNSNENKQQNDNADIMVQLVQKLENLSVSIEKLQSSNNNNCNNSDVMINNNNKNKPSSGGVNKTGSSRLSSGMTGTSKLLTPTSSSSAVPLTSATAAV